MIRIKDIQQALLHVVGWEQSYDPSMIIDDGMTRTESGLTFQGAHPLMTLENISSIMPDNWNAKYAEWNAILSYTAGRIVRHNGIVWIARIDNVGEEPTASDFNDDYSRDDYGNPYWKPYNPMSEYLERITRNGIAAAMQTFVQIKQLDKETKSLFERRAMFDGAGRIEAAIDNKHRIVGFELMPVRTMGVTTHIEKIGLQFTQPGPVRLYLFHSSRVKPVKSVVVEYMRHGGFQWFDLDEWFLPYISAETNAGGAWYVVYNQDELPVGMNAINFARDWSREPCGTCNAGSVEVWRSITRYLSFSPFVVSAPKTFEQFPELWDINDMQYTNTHNYGMNFELSVGCDLTDFIISQRDIFANVIQKQVAVMALRTMAMNPNVRVNRNQTNVNRQEILYELDGNTMGHRPGGLGYEAKKAYEALKIDTQGIDEMCLGCNNHGVRYTTV